MGEGGGNQRQHLQAGAGAQLQVCHGSHMHLNTLQAVAVLNLHKVRQRIMLTAPFAYTR